MINWIITCVDLILYLFLIERGQIINNAEIVSCGVVNQNTNANVNSRKIRDEVRNILREKFRK